MDRQTQAGVANRHRSRSPVIIAGGRKVPRTSAQELRKAGQTIADLDRAGYSPEEILRAGYPATELRDAGYFATMLKHAGYSAKELRGAGYQDGSILKMFTSIEDLRNAGFSAVEIQLGAGKTAPEWLRAGNSVRELERIGYSVKELRAAGVQDDSFMGTCFSAKELRIGGVEHDKIVRLCRSRGRLGELKEARIGSVVEGTIYYRGHCQGSC